MEKREIVISDGLKIERIKKTIFDIRGVRGYKVLLDRDLAIIYGVETRSLNQAVKRNIGRFPADFMFQLTLEEWMTIEKQSNMSSQSVMTSPNRRPKSSLPFAFTEYGAGEIFNILLYFYKLHCIGCLVYLRPQVYPRIEERLRGAGVLREVGAFFYFLFFCFLFIFVALFKNNSL